MEWVTVLNRQGRAGQDTADRNKVIQKPVLCNTSPSTSVIILNFHIKLTEITNGKYYHPFREKYTHPDLRNVN